MAFGPRPGNERDASRPRYEYRVWGSDLAAHYARLREIGQLRDIEDSEESYVVSTVCSAFNAKIRGGVLDVKRLLKEERRLELWQAFLKLNFPLTSQTVRDQVGPIFSLDLGSGLRPAYDPEEFARQIVSPCAHLILVPVRKQRFRFLIEDCLAEFTEVMIGGKRQDTAAVESENATATLRAALRLGISGLENTNYQRALRAALGLDGAARDDGRR